MKKPKATAHRKEALVLGLQVQGCSLASLDPAIPTEAVPGDDLVVICVDRTHPQRHLQARFYSINGSSYSLTVSIGE